MTNSVLDRNDKSENNKTIIEKYIELDKFIILVKRVLSWEENYIRLDNFYKTKGRYPHKAKAENDEEKSLYEWMNDQKRHKEKYEKSDKHRYNKLMKLPNWKWAKSLETKRLNLKEGIKNILNGIT